MEEFFTMTMWQPRRNWLQEKIDELNSQLPDTTAQETEKAWWQTTLSAVGKPFEWFSQKVEKPFASIITSPFSPDIEGTEGMSWLERERAE